MPLCSKKVDKAVCRSNKGTSPSPTSSPASAKNTVSPSSTAPDLKLIINGKNYFLGPEVHPELSLLRYIRDHANLKGTKSMCYEGGCGLCTVIGTYKDPQKNEFKTITLRSCQTLVYSVIGWSIITIEHLGDRQIGYDKLQVAIHGFYGTQCGYCTPGFVMAMKGEMEGAESLTAKEIEMLLDGNICRCTGYRPILEAFKSFASDAPKELTTKLKDIEDAYEAKCPKTGDNCNGACNKSTEECAKLAFSLDNKFVIEKCGITWYYPKTVEDIYSIIKEKSSTGKIRIVVGNTGQGIFKNDGPYDDYIVTTGVKSLYEITYKPHFVIGANVSLTQCIGAFNHAAKNYRGYKHMTEVAKHWENVANTGVRNVGSWSGNMRMKHDHKAFASDIFVTLAGVDVQLKVGGLNGKVTDVSAQEFLSYDMSNSIILSMKIPQQSDDTHLRCYKISARAVNSKAFLNASIRLQLNPKETIKVANIPTIVIGGIDASFVRASKTEKALLGKVLSNPEDVKKAIETLGEEVEPAVVPTDPSPEFRKLVSQCLLYKAILSILGSLASSQVKSGGTKLERPVSTSQQNFDANKDTWPVGQPVEKLESRIQISGEAEYLDDIPDLPGELYGAFVQSQRATGKIKSLDASKCLEMDGVVDFFTVKDIPGKNTFFVSPPKMGDDPVFADEELKYHGQAIGVVVAETRELAKAGAKLVEVSYEEGVKPVLTIKQAMETENRYHKSPDFTGSTEALEFGNVEQALKKSKHVIEGEVSFGSQYHFTMEPIAARTVPTEDGYDVWCTTQWPTETQNVVSTVLDIPASSINISVRRIGGAYGCKISRSHLVAAASAIAAHKLKRPVRIALDIETQMTLVGWREPYYSKYKVGFDTKGILSAVSVDICSDVGLVANENSSFVAAHAIPNAYYCPNWKIQCYYAQTDTPTNTWCRTPGHVEALGTIENIIERIAHVVKKDPHEIREMNFTSKNKQHFLSDRKGENLIQTKIFPFLIKQAEIDARKKAVAEFNENNKWKKRGLSLIPMLYPYDVFPIFVYNVQVVIYEHDGAVAVKHGGVEMGQGINTKVAQVVAKGLGVPLDLVKVKPTDNFVAANSSVTGGSFGSDVNAHGARICSERLRIRIDEVAKRNKIKRRPDTWTELVKKCFAEQVDLSERYCTFGNEHPKGYDIWGAACTEVELDVLTGQFLVLRSDIVEDCGRSLSPFVDMGQVEGAFIMGLGFFTCEEVKHDPDTGGKLTIGTVNYKPPSALDIPIDFRVSFLPKGDNEFGVLRSKATGEPPLCLSYSVVTALRQAIASKRSDDGKDEWFDMDVPLTIEKIHLLCEIDSSQFKL